MSATIKQFQVGYKRFSHVMNSDHDSVDLRDEGNATLLTYGANSSVNNARGRIGFFNVEYFEGRPLWVYYEMTGETRYECGVDRRTAEVAVSRRFIGSSSHQAPASTQL